MFQTDGHVICGALQFVSDGENLTCRITGNSEDGEAVQPWDIEDGDLIVIYASNCREMLADQPVMSLSDIRKALHEEMMDRYGEFSEEMTEALYDDPEGFFKALGFYKRVQDDNNKFIPTRGQQFDDFMQEHSGKKAPMFMIRDPEKGLAVPVAAAFNEGFIPYREDASPILYAGVVDLEAVEKTIRLQDQEGNAVEYGFKSVQKGFAPGAWASLFLNGNHAKIIKPFGYGMA